MSLLSLIGNTPLLELKGVDAGLCKLFVKLEGQNPTGSIKDRIALSMVLDAEKRGVLKPGGTIVEATAGNTGLALALVAALRGYRLVLVIPDKMSREKISHVKAMGAEVVVTRSDVGRGHPDYYQDRAAAIAQSIEGAWYANQFGNPANPKAHEEGTGPEIWNQTEGSVDAIVCGVGSSGTMTGLSRYFARVAPHVDLVLADPVGSILTHYIKTGEVLTEVGSWIVEGIGEDFIPPVADLSRVKHAYSISDRESLGTSRSLLKKFGIIGGSSTGTLVSAALRYCKEQTTPKKVVTFICDSGNKYLSKIYNDQWMVDQGMLERPVRGDLRDLIGRWFEEGSTVTIKPDETLRNAYGLMKNHDVSQLPVVEGKKIVGIIDESDLLLSVSQDRKNFSKLVRDIMGRDLILIDPRESIESLPKLFDKGLVALVADGERFYGVITRMDFLNYLRKQAI